MLRGGVLTFGSLQKCLSKYARVEVADGSMYLEKGELVRHKSYKKEDEVQSADSHFASHSGI